MAWFADILYVGISEWSSHQMLVMVASDWDPLKSEGLMSCIFLGFEILHVEDFMDVQVVGLMVPWILVLVLTWVGAWYLHLWLPVWVPLQHELNMRNMKCFSDFLWYVHCEVDLEYEIFFCDRVLCNSTRKFVQHLLHMNVEMKHDVSLPCLYFLFSPALTAWTWLGFLITFSSILTICLASSYVDLRWVFLQ